MSVGFIKIRHKGDGKYVFTYPNGQVVDVRPGPPGEPQTCRVIRPGKVGQ